MGHVVHQGRDADQPGIVRSDALAFPAERLQDPLRRGQRAQGVVKAGVRAAGVNEVRRAQLLDAPQPLHFAAVEDARLFLREFDVAVYRIADDHPSSSFALDPLMLAHATPWLFPRFSPDDNPGTGLRVRIFRADADA